MAEKLLSIALLPLTHPAGCCPMEVRLSEMLVSQNHYLLWLDGLAAADAVAVPGAASGDMIRARQSLGKIVL